jgi:hypothetical protein
MWKTMKVLTLASLIFMVAVAVAKAESGFYYSPERSGEGLTLTIDKDDRIAFAFYTYWPEKIAILPATPKFDYYKLPCRNCSTWFVANGIYLKGAAVGEMTMTIPYHYPTTEPYTGTSTGILAERIPVATFLLEANGEGFDMSLDCYPQILPPSIYMCNNTFHFTRKIIGE